MPRNLNEVWYTFMIGVNAVLHTVIVVIICITVYAAIRVLRHNSKFLGLLAQ